MTAPLLLASGSLRRKMLLEDLGVTIRAVPPISQGVMPGEAPVHYAADGSKGPCGRPTDGVDPLRRARGTPEVQ